MKKKNQYLFVYVMIFILNLILYLIFILIFFIGPHICKYLIFFFNRYFLYFGCLFLGLDFFLSFLYDLINNIRDIIYLDFYFVIIPYSIFVKDVILFNYLFFVIYYIYIFLDKK